MLCQSLCVVAGRADVKEARIAKQTRQHPGRLLARACEYRKRHVRRLRERVEQPMLCPGELSWKSSFLAAGVQPTDAFSTGSINCPKC